MPQSLDIRNFSQEKLAAWLQSQGETPYRSEQIMRWIYHQRVESFSEMTNLSKTLRAKLADNMTISNQSPVDIRTSADNTKKFLTKLEDGQHVESVLIPQKNHWTLCISSQVGCAMGCKFCFTGKNGFVRNLKPSEIINQICVAQKLVPSPEQPTNIVFMGMGEPLANYENVLTALKIITSANGFKLANRRVTVSTAGLVPRISSLGQDTKVSLAVSLNAVDDKTRDHLMPINRTYPIEMLLRECQRFPLHGKRMITFEYVLIDDVNDSPEHAKRLAAILTPLRAKINLIPFNPFEGSLLKQPTELTIVKFQEILMKRNFTAIVRKSKGPDIMAACGQLRAASQRSSQCDTSIAKI